MGEKHHVYLMKCGYRALSRSAGLNVDDEDLTKEGWPTAHCSLRCLLRGFVPDFIESGHCLQTGLVQVMETLQTHNRRVTKLYEGGEWSWRCYVAITDLGLRFSPALD